MQTKKYRINKSKRNTRKKIRGGEETLKNDIIYLNDKFNIDPNKKYKTVGIAHHTELAGINVVRDLGNQIANFFGQSGFDGGLYSGYRNRAIDTVISKLNDKQKIKDPKFDIELKEEFGIQIHLTAIILEEINDNKKEDKKEPEKEE